METMRVGGQDVPVAVVRTAVISLQGLEQANPIALYELVLACQDPAHVPFGNTAEAMRRFGLVLDVADAGAVTVHECTRAVILAVTEVGEYGATLDISRLQPISLEELAALNPGLDERGLARLQAFEQLLAEDDAASGYQDPDEPPDSCEGEGTSLADEWTRHGEPLPGTCDDEKQRQEHEDAELYFMAGALAEGRQPHVVPPGWHLECPKCRTVGGRHAEGCEGIAIPRLDR